MHVHGMYKDDCWVGDGTELRITTPYILYEQTAEYTWTEYKTNREGEELNITVVLNKIQDSRRNWIRHVNTMPRNR
jgi:hypothetical protein